MKRLSIFLILLLSVFTVFAGGIGSVKDLAAFVKAVNKGEDISAWQNEKGAVCLECDIDMAKMKKWTPIRSFAGTFDGKGFALKNWKTKSGLIDTLNTGGIVCNLRIDGSCSMNVVSKEAVSAGFVVNVNKGTVYRCENGGSVTYKGAYTEKHIYIGGLVGQNGHSIHDCRNTGAIKAESHIASANKKLDVTVGGIAASTISKGHRNIVIYRCENTGAISFSGDTPRIYVGGVIGYSGRAGIRYCTNRGDISVEGVQGNPEAKYYGHVAGVVAQIANHVQCCDNFGAVSVAGTHSTYVAGICSTLARDCNLLGSSNYGNISTKCSVSSYAGGIMGASGEGAQLCNCNNYGSVRFNGLAAKNATCVGGLVGYIFSKAKTKYGSRIRQSNNFGEIASDAAGSKICVGGLFGRSRGNAAADIKVVDCVNKGNVVAEGCQAGDVAGNMSYTSVVGDYFDNNMAQAVDAAEGEHNLFGRVTNTQGEAVVGAVISDGTHCVKTNAEGYYKMKSNLAMARFVTISVPSEYKMPYRKNVPQNFRRIPRHAKAVSANFVLEKREKPTDKYTVVMIGDPQIKGVKVDSAAYKLKNVIYPDIVALKQSKAESEGEFFAINLGDLVFNDMTKMDDYVEIVAGSNIPMVHVIGNHDHDQTTFYETRLGTAHFEEYLTPTYYSFNIGKVHYVMVNDISFARKNFKERYRTGLEYSHYKWLERDLSFVPKDHTIVICGHAQLFRTYGAKDAENKRSLSYARYSKLLSQYARVYSWSGHYHYNFGYDYSESNLENLKNITSICVARACGGLHCNRDLNNDGTPNGYMVMEVDGDNFEWYYKSIGHDRSYQMHVYDPSRTGGEFVKVNVWNWSKNYWSTPEWWENGVKVCDMICKPERDIAFLEDHAKQGPHILGGRDKSDKARPYKAHGMFYVKPSAGARSGEVRVTDNFGRSYIEKVEW